MRTTSAATTVIKPLEEQLEALDRHGFLLVRQALDETSVLAWQACLSRK